MTHNAVLLRTDAGAELTAIAADATKREAAWAFARKIAAKSAHVVKIGKAAFYRQLENGPRQGGVRIYRRGDGREHDGARRAGRHLRLRREACPNMARPVSALAGECTCQSSRAAPGLYQCCTGG